MGGWTTLVVCEKKEAARDVAGALIGPDAKAFSKRNPPYVGGGYCVMACQGHLLDLAEPGDVDPKWADRWREDTLPVSIPDWPVRPFGGYRGKVLGELCSAARAAERIVHAGDPDAEGQLIVDEVLEHAGVDPYGPNVVRALVNNNLPDEVRREVARARPNAEYRDMARAAAARRLGDMTFGVNESRLLAIRTGTASDRIGRVMAPTLGLLVKRHLARMGHKERPFWELVGWLMVRDAGTWLAVPYRLRPSEAMLAGERHVFDKDRMVEAKAAWERLKLGEVEFKARQRKELPPLPFSLLSLTKEMGERWGMRPQEVLDATQRLRDERKAITYNRTDCEHLEDGHYEEAPRTLAMALANVGAKKDAWPVDLGLKGRCFDSSKVSAHHAIIPQAVRVDVASLREDDRRVYTAIVERYAMQFMPPRVYEEVASEVPLEGFGTMAARYERDLWPGWRGAFPKRERRQAEDDGAPKEAAFPACPAVTPGRHTAKVAEQPASSVVERKTAPPPAYTEATLLVDMANVAKYVKDPVLREALVKADEGKASENGSIGTPATRAEIVEKLKSSGYAEDKGKQIVPTVRGIALYQALPSEISGPELTARWQLMLGEVAQGKRGVDCVAASCVESFMRHKDDAYRNVSLPREGAHVVGACPRCGKPAELREGTSRDGSAWARVSCSSNAWRKGEDGKRVLAAGCGWSQGCVVCGKKLAQRTVATLLSEGRTSVLKGFRKKDGKGTFDAALKLGRDGRFEFDFPERTPRKGAPSKARSKGPARPKGNTRE